MLIIDPKETLMFLVISFVTFSLFYLMQNHIKKQYKKSRELKNSVMGNIHSLITGVRELRVNAYMRHAFFNTDSIPTLKRYHKQQSLISNYEQLTVCWFWTSFYIVLGASIYVLEDQHIVNKVKFILPLLMIFGPMTMIMSVINIFYSANAALDKIEALHVTDITFQARNVEAFKSARIVDAEYVYSQEMEESVFGIGPINFDIIPGKIIFIVGGNGSGKSTLIKLITGLYYPSKGKMIVNGNPITSPADIEDYQTYLTVIYQTPHIFSMILAVDMSVKHNEFLDYLELFELKEKVILDGNRLVNLDILSYGLKKRLVLLISLLEVKPIYIFDEWAADQDPHFRQIFYLTILPKLKSMGKAIIAVTHDEEYFDQADTIIKLREGHQVKMS